MSGKRRMNSRWRRHQQRQQSRAVSPVVATLILILVAVAAAAALYLWLVQWQHGVTNNIGNPSAQPSLSIGGSTSVYPFTQVAIAQFQQNHTDVVVSNSQGGSGAGMIAVCHGAVDIGTTSTLQTTANLQTNFGCPSTTVVTTVAYDAVDIVLPSANPNAITSMNQSVILGIYLVQSSTISTLPMPAYLVASGWVAGAGTLQWNDIPRTAGCLTAGQQLPPGGVGGGCAFSASTNKIDTVTRSDPGGTTQSFEARLLGATSNAAVATSVAGLGWGGCGSSNSLGDCAMTPTKSGLGNPGVISTVSGDANAIGFASDGLARASGSGVTFLAFAGPGQSPAVSPTLGHTGTISLGIQGLPGGYVGWRPFQFVTTNTPTGEAAFFLNYVLDPANNQNFATETQEVSVYQV